MNFVIHWNEKALGSHVFPIPIPPPTSLPTRSLQVLPEIILDVLYCKYPMWTLCFGYLPQCNTLAKLGDLRVFYAYRFFGLGTQKGTVDILISSLWCLTPQLGRRKWFSEIIGKLLLPGTWVGLIWRLGSAGTFSWHAHLNFSICLDFLQHESWGPRRRQAFLKTKEKNEWPIWPNQPTAVHHQPKPPLDTPGQVWVSHLWGHCSFLLGPAARFGALSVAVHKWELLKEVTVIFITFTIVWPQVNSREGTQLHPPTENWIKDLLSMALPIRTRPSFPLSQSLPSGIFHKPHIILHQRADRLKTTITEN